MKIEQELRPTIGKNQQGLSNKQVGTAKFTDLVQKNNQKLQIDELNKLMTNIDEAGTRLTRSRTFQELAKYQKLVKEFVHETVEYGLGLKQSRSFNQFGKSRQLTIVEAIDEKLLELSADVIDNEKKSIDILGKVGEIKGLLINLYM